MGNAAIATRRATWHLTRVARYLNGDDAELPARPDLISAPASRWPRSGTCNARIPAGGLTRKGRRDESSRGFRFRSAPEPVDAVDAQQPALRRAERPPAAESTNRDAGRPLPPPRPSETSWIRAMAAGSGFDGVQPLPGRDCRSRRREVREQVSRVHLEKLHRLGQAAESPGAKAPQADPVWDRLADRRAHSR